MSASIVVVDDADGASMQEDDSGVSKPAPLPCRNPPTREKHAPALVDKLCV